MADLIASMADLIASMAVVRDKSGGLFMFLRVLEEAVAFSLFLACWF